MQALRRASVAALPRLATATRTPAAVSLVAARSLADAPAQGGAPDKLTLNLACPHQVVHKGKKVGLVTLPGVIGEFGVTAGHTPIIAELKPGLLQIFESVGDSEPVEKWFISGGFSMSHESSTTDIMAVECVKLQDLDAEAAKRGVAQFRAAVEAAAPDSQERAVAQISLDVHEAMCSALGVQA